MLALSMGTMFLLSGCGTKQEVISDYGTEASTNKESGSTGDKSDGTENISGNATQKASEKESTEIPEARNGRNLSEQLGGSSFNIVQDFAIGSLPAKMNIHYTVSDSDTLPSWSMREITEDRVYEKEVVEAILGDTAKEVRRGLSKSKGDAEHVRDAAMDIYYMYNDSQNIIPSQESGDYVIISNANSEEKEIPGWEDEEQYYIHTYEGKYMDLDYEVLVGYRKDLKSKVIAFGPKNWGDVSGDPAMKYVKTVRGGNVYIADIGDSGELTAWKDVPVASILSHPENYTQANIETLEKTGEEFIKKLRISNPAGSLGITGQDVYYEGDELVSTKLVNPILFVAYDQDRMSIDNTAGQTAEDLADSRLNGYVAGMSLGVNGMNVYSDNSEGIACENLGALYLTDQGPISGYFYIFWEYVETLSEQVAILPFEAAVEAFQANVGNELNTAKITGSPVEFCQLQMGYYPWKSPEDTGEVTFIPVWIYDIVVNGNFYLGQAVQNAIDGSVITVRYNE